MNSDIIKDNTISRPTQNLLLMEFGYYVVALRETAVQLLKLVYTFGFQIYGFECAC